MQVDLYILDPEFRSKGSLSGQMYFLSEVPSKVYISPNLAQNPCYFAIFPKQRTCLWYNFLILGHTNYTVPHGWSRKGLYSKRPFIRIFPSICISIVFQCLIWCFLKPVPIRPIIGIPQTRTPPRHLAHIVTQGSNPGAPYKDHIGRGHM